MLAPRIPLHWTIHKSAHDIVANAGRRNVKGKAGAVSALTRARIAGNSIAKGGIAEDLIRDAQRRGLDF